MLDHPNSIVRAPYKYGDIYLKVNESDAYLHTMHTKNTHEGRSIPKEAKRAVYIIQNHNEFNY